MSPHGDDPPPPAYTIHSLYPDRPTKKHSNTALDVIFFIFIGALVLFVILAVLHFFIRRDDGRVYIINPFRTCIEMRKEKKAQKESEEEARRMRLRMDDL